MCGIAGLIDRYEDISQKQGIIANMSSQLGKRGPDQDGVYINQQQGVCLIHRRLIVIDPAGGIQPMSKKGRDLCTIVYNGELYNTEDLRGELLSVGYTFSGHSDTEVLLTAYLHWGEKCVDKLNGIFAFAIWDEENRRLFIARDKIGVKPLFYYEYKGGLIFASEIKAILANPIVKPQIDENGLNEIFFIGPGRTGGMGIFKGIRELLPGECGTYKNGALVCHKYFSVTAKPHTDSQEQTIEKTRFLLTDAIKRQLVADVPLCCFLSGGLDSSIISKVASDYYKENNKGQLTTYSVDYVDNAKYFVKSLFQPNSDNHYIKLMSEFIGSDHREVILDNNALYEALLPSVAARDLPAMVDVDSSLLLFCEAVKRDYTVALSGECADELFGGYPWYHNKDILFEQCFPWSRSLDIRRSVLKAGLLPRGEDYVLQRYSDTVNKTEKLSTDTPLEARMREMFMLNFNWFMQGLLDRKDRMSMYNGLEVRVPFCDYRLVEYAYNMPWSLKALDGREKGIIRTAMDGILPDEIVWRKKSPYPKTHNPIYFNLVCQGAKRVLQDKDSVLGNMLSEKGVMDIIENPEGISSPWYGQLMRAPQILAYIIQMDYWFKKYNVQVIGM
ncbi:MAG TPA: asparagine synthase (glutamine-hydrolyzing) [Clostridiales bacterium]|nr:asparagine synthase (glutamine-hydrolyzing) [Clostridiales bacterium]